MTAAGGNIPPAPEAPERSARPRSAAALTILALLGLALIAGFSALGVWQVERRAWKLDLIARVDARVHAGPVPAPGPDAWPTISAADGEYLRVALTGVFDHAKETLTQATTDLGAGFWVMTPLRTREGFTVLVNRGFVPPERRAPASRAAAQTPGETTVTGLLRVTEPKGGFLRANDPARDLWRSRDVAAISETRGLDHVAPYFVDADRTPNPGGWPVGGLTVIAFPNSHLVYALTWFGLALMVAAAAVVVARHERRVRRETRAT
ncbi:surfeit locus 1 family protein [Methylopila capsulata]|uniref:SURF1-like protein n=1 Tax=Methylopila capsulata TaxID=61654 RepID=A0A9W6MTD0_9HYPH|nr:SURF1 family protein [Methylopila capsulata]MBM7853576.1 surfeit locus 1 family protein [Methylopila capsulata]GLK57209.1 SURF1-like protein [Methylopila capsulata]